MVCVQVCDDLEAAIERYDLSLDMLLQDPGFRSVDELMREVVKTDAINRIPIS